jgi:hypothetical protein
VPRNPHSYRLSPIRLYEGSAASKTADRAVKAKALLQAEKVYHQIVPWSRDGRPVARMQSAHGVWS